MSPSNQTLVCIHDATEMLLRHRLELETAVRALQMVQHMILKVNPSIKQVVIKTSPSLVRTATSQLPMWEEPDGLLEANVDRITNGDALLDLSRHIRGLENMGILVQFFPALQSRNQQAYAVAGHVLLSKPWEADVVVAEPEPSSAMHVASSSSSIMNMPQPSTAWWQYGERSGTTELDVLVISLRTLPDCEYITVRRLFRASRRYHVANNSSAALHALQLHRPTTTILVTGVGIWDPSARELLKLLARCAEDGGATVVFSYFLGGDDDTTPTGYNNAFQQSFPSLFGLRWRLLPYRRRLAFSYNPAATAIAPIKAAAGSCLPHVYQPTTGGGLFEGVLRRSALFLPSTHVRLAETLNGREWVGCGVDVRPAEDATVSLPVPAAMAPVGRGWVGVVGSVCADEETDQIVYSMCGLG
ncbi:hypothetical protein DBV05_g7161 [Lasiodiplodia theobromae]|uniref:Uncharacterized protein n=1 Tax=Lasiodiplodia theobromae TaxID=45133 RepID=A0A5N5D8Q6_9PEZI|nr:hypothetical protein DBV05_g7161 [Lasiodiplodia theobromae]